MRRVRAEAAGIECFRLMQHPFGEAIRRRRLTADFVAQSPYHHRRVVSVARDHLAQLLETVGHDVAVRLGPHALKRVGAPRGHFALHENAVTVAVVEYSLGLRPVHARENAIELLQVAAIVLDPLRRFRHAEIRMTTGHALDAHQANLLAVQMECTALYLESPDAKRRPDVMALLAIIDRRFEAIEVR